MKRFLPAVIAVLLGLPGCATSKTSESRPERGPDGTIAYMVRVEASEPGARIEVNGEDVGTAPLTLKIFGDKDGTFHNFGRYEYVIKAYPTGHGQYVQTKVFRTGGWFTSEDLVPKRIFFHMGLVPTTATQKIDVNVTSE